MWYVYILKCADSSFYTGITNDLNRRIEEHNNSRKGAKYTKGRRPVALAYHKKYRTRGKAQKRESEIKKLSRGDKKRLTENNL